MTLARSLWISVSLGLLLAGNSAFAEGHGHGQGLNRALSAAARGAGNSGLARAAQSTTRSGNGLSRDVSKLGRSANGLNRASSGMSHSQALAAQTSNAARIRDHRLQQADHLREISGRNGNERLLDTADRMQNSAQTNYDRRVGSSDDTGSEAPPAATGDSVGAAVSAPPAPSPRASWLPAWLRSSR
jgi:hypothetical protein